MGNFKEDIAKVKAIVLDVDGVLTDGDIIVTPEGDFLRKYNAKDGFALAYAIKRGFPVGIITGGRGKCLELRLDMLGIRHKYMNCIDKPSALKDFIEKTGIAAEDILFMGDDIPDIEPMMHVGMPVCPADAVPEIMKISRYVSQFKGGAGCVRDIVEQVLRARGEWIHPGDSMPPSA